MIETPQVIRSPGPPLALDSLKIQLQPGTAVDLHKGGFCHVPRFDVSTGELISEKWMAGKQGYGLNSFTLPSEAAGLVIELSAKLLGSSYLDGITRAHLDRVADAIKATGICPQLTPEDLLDSNVQSVDPTAAIRVEAGQIPEYLRAFSILQASGGFDVTPYEGEGICLNRNRRNGRDRLVIYDKARELTYTAMGRAFLRDVPGVDPTGVIRAERHARRLEPVRRCAGRESGRVSLGELYDTAAQPVADLYDEAASPLSPPVVASDFLGYVRAGFSLNEAAGRVGRDRILDALENDLDRVQAMLKEGDRIRGGHGNYGREMKAYRIASLARLGSPETTSEGSRLHGLVLDFGRRLRALQTA
jgi:hypothetical protein